MKREEVFFESRDGHSTICGMKYMPDEGEPKAVLQIIHGMAEHIERYEGFAEFMTQNGFIVVAEDHLGHGKTIAKNEGAMPGFMCEKDPATVIVRDAHSLKKMIQKEYFNLPYFVLGHSMGSFMVRDYMSRYGKGVDGVIVMGTGMMSSFMVHMGRFLVSFRNTFVSKKKTSTFLNGVCFGAYNKRIENNRTDFDWLTKDEKIVDKYIEDPLCGFLFTGNGFEGLMEVMKRSCKAKNIARIPKKLPVLLVSGAEDPVGEYGKGVKKYYRALLANGLEDVSIKLYADDRHEILNETDKKEVMNDILGWLESKM